MRKEKKIKMVVLAIDSESINEKGKKIKMVLLAIDSESMNEKQELRMVVISKDG